MTWIVGTAIASAVILWLARYARFQKIDGRFVHWGQNDYLISIPCSLMRHDCWEPTLDTIIYRRKRLQIGFGRLPVPGFHLRVGIQ
jgi:hypothetical protein